MVIKLYIDYGSQPSRAVLALCLIGKIPFEIIEIKIMKLEMRSQNYEKINPMKKVPAIEDTEAQITLAESHAIMRYLCAKYKLNQNWYPSINLVHQAKINQYLDFHHLNTRKCSHLIFNSLFAPKLQYSDPTFQTQHTIKLVKSSLKSIERIYLKNSPYLTGQLPSIADLSAFFEIQFLILLDFDFNKFPLVQKWIQKMREIKQVQEANKGFYKFKDKLKALKPANFPKL